VGQGSGFSLVEDTVRDDHDDNDDYKRSSVIASVLSTGGINVTSSCGLLGCDSVH
jgi:hypothetical protein